MANLLERARRVYAGLQAACTTSRPDEQNEVSTAPAAQGRGSGYELNEVNEQSGPPPDFVLVRDAAHLPRVLEALAASDVVGLDVETVGLDANRGRLRLLQLAPDRGGPTFI